MRVVMERAWKPNDLSEKRFGYEMQKGLRCFFLSVLELGFIHVPLSAIHTQGVLMHPET